LAERIEALVNERKRLERELSEARRALATGGGAGATEAKLVGGVKFAARRLEGVPAKDLRGMADALKKQIGSGVVALVTVADGKAALVVGVTDDLTGRLSAVDLVRAGSAELGGAGGGGRPYMAQAGGPDGARADGALAAIERALAAGAKAA
jgi:alanyl-tRNA synthetase